MSNSWSYTKNSPVVPSEMVSANLNIAKYYIEHGEAARALPILQKQTLANRANRPSCSTRRSYGMAGGWKKQANMPRPFPQLAQSIPVAKQISKNNIPKH
jgi:hypothetical protein